MALIKGNHADNVLNGTHGNDTILGLGGNDQLRGLGGDDLLVGGTGNDRAWMGSGNDTFVWEPGDGDDQVAGEAGHDTLVFNGSDGDELMTVTTTGAGRFQFFRDLGDIQVDTSSVERVITDMRGGNDRYDASAQTDANVRVLVKGGEGNDRIVGGAGNDTLDGGAGNDLLVGGRGNDVASLGHGNDRFVWEPGDGDDKMDGGSGTDTLEFNGSDGDELMTVTTTGAGKFQFFRDLGDIQVDAVRTEWIVTDMRGGNDRYDASAQTDAAVRVNVKGGHGNDIMTGGAGNDLMAGGSGDDLFRFVKTASGVDTIVDFTKGDDHIDLRAIDANVGATGNQAFSFIGSAAFTHAGQVRVVDLGATRLIQANTDHDAAAELQIRLADIHLGSADFLL